MSGLDVIASSSATIQEGAATTPDPGSLVLRLADEASSTDLWVLLDVENPVPVGEGASVVSATLRLRRAAAWVAGPTTITVERPSAPWDASTVTWNTQPAVYSGSATLTGVGAGAADDTINTTVTSLIQTAVDAIEAGTQSWYGLRLKVNTAGTHTLHSVSASPDLAPLLIIEWSVPPEAPDDLQPTAGRHVSETKPELRATFVDEDAEDVVSAIQVQVHTADDFSGTLTYDSTKVTHNVCSFDMNAPPAGAAAAPTLSVATTYFWRMKSWDQHDRESEWAEAAEFRITAKGTLTITAPTAGALDNPLTSTSWTLTGATQSAYSVEVEEKVGDVWQLHYAWSKTVGSATSVTVPDDYGLLRSKTYRITVRAWDSISREDMSGDRKHYESSVEVTTV